MLLRLFNKKHKPNPIFGALGTDMHMHLLPSVDDGSKSLEESLECLRTLASLGYRRAILTPHFQYPRFQNKEFDIERRFAEFSQQVAQAGLDIELVCVSGEYRIDSGFQARLDQPAFLTFGNNYVLVEFSLNHPMMGVDDMIFDLQMKGYEVILAHPERYPYIALDGDRYQRMKDAGVYFQCNILSLVGFYGAECRRKALAMIDRGWSEFLGTDTHNTMYTRALVEASNDRTVQRIISHNQFMNKEL
ncbi:MAG: hypothetical protein IJ789_00435 [Bacteroidales bacterium]|nr:hypothetical protein [Bacteroidales bacterium]